MTKHFFAAFLLTCCFAQFSVGQDLLISTSGDTLNVDLEKIQNGYIHYKQQGRSETERFPVNRVFLYSTDFFKAPIQQQVTQPKDSDAIASKPSMNWPTIRIAAQGGWSSLIGAIGEDVSPVEKEYLQKLKKGMNLGAGIDIFFHEYIGIGLGYNWFNSTSAIQNAYVDDNYVGTIEEDITVQFIGPRILGRFSFAKEKATVIVHVSGGQAWYKNNVFYAGSYVLKSSNFGGSVGAGLDYRLDESFAIGIDANLFAVLLKNFEAGTAGSNYTVQYQPEAANNISRVDLSVGLRWYL